MCNHLTTFQVRRFAYENGLIRQPFSDLIYACEVKTYMPMHKCDAHATFTYVMNAHATFSDLILVGLLIKKERGRNQICEM